MPKTLTRRPQAAASADTRCAASPVVRPGAAALVAVLLTLACALTAASAPEAWALGEPSGNWTATETDEDGNTNLAYGIGDYTSWYDPDATELCIDNAFELAWLSHLVQTGTNFSGKTITLQNDIDLSGHWWDPIGNSSSKYFAGTFDGAGRSIKCMSIGLDSNMGSTSPASQYAGLFGYVKGATIENLTLDATCSISLVPSNSSCPKYVGSVVAYSAAGAANHVLNCTSSASVTTLARVSTVSSISSAYYLGGIIGYALGAAGSSIENCVHKGTLTRLGASSATYMYVGAVGGVAGYAGTLTIKNCSNEGLLDCSDVTYSANRNKGSFVGGIVGYGLGTSMAPLVISDCGNSGEFKSWNVTASTATSTAFYTYSGIAGIAAYVTQATIQNCENSQSITASQLSAAGIVACAYTGVTVSGCFNEGAITANDAALTSTTFAAQYVTRAGGIVGAQAGTNGKIVNCYNKGEISATGTVPAAGGMVGFFSNKAAVENCLNEGAVTIDSKGKNGSAGGIVGVGTVGTLTVTSCANKGKVSSGSAGAFLGGISGGGWSTPANNPVISQCANEAAVSAEGANSYAGGIAGNAGNKDITCSYNVGTISSGDGYAGGLAGKTTGTLANTKTSTNFLQYAGCYNAGRVTSDGKAGAVVGEVADPANLTTYGTASSYMSNYEQTYYLEGCVSDEDGGSSKAIGRAMADWQNFYYDSSVDAFVSDPSNNASAHALTSDELKAAAVELDPAFSAYVVNGMEPVVNGGYPLLAWQVPSTLHYRNVSDTFDVLVVGVNDGAALAGSKVSSLYQANHGTLLPTDTGELPAGYELAADVQWASEPGGQAAASVKTGAAQDDAEVVEGMYDASKQGSASVYATGIYDQDGSYVSALATYRITYQGVDADANNGNPVEYKLSDQDIPLAAPTAPAGKVFVGWIEGSYLDTVNTKYAGKFNAVPNVVLQASKNMVSSIPAGSAGDKVFTAVWAEGATVTVRYQNPQGGESAIAVPSSVVLKRENAPVEADADTGLIDFTQVFKPAEGTSPAPGYLSVGYEPVYTVVKNVEEIQVTGEDGETTVQATTETICTLNLALASGNMVKVSLALNPNGGEVPYPAPANFTVADAFVLPTPVYGAREFNTWFLDEDLTVSAGTKDERGVAFSGLAAFATDEDGKYKYLAEGEDGSLALTLNAGWLVYDITYELDGGVLPEGYPETFDLDKGKTDLSVYEPPKRAGYDFVGWYADEAFETDGTIIDRSVSGNVTRYAKWVPCEYEVDLHLGVAADDPWPASWTDDFNADNGFTLAQGESEDYYLYSYSAETLDGSDFVLPTPERVGYDFYAWLKADDDGNLNILKRVTALYANGVTHEDMSLSAWWAIKKYAITFDMGGGEYDGELPSSFDIKSEVIDLSGIEPERERYGFDGWFIDSTLGTQVSSVAGMDWDRWYDVTLYAKWAPKEYAVSYELNGGTNAEGNPTSFTAESGVAPLSDPKRMGYVFAGWYLDSDFTTKVTEVAGEGWDQWSDVTLYAKWDEPAGGSGDTAVLVAPSAGVVTVAVDESFPFSNAEIVRIAREDGSFETTAVVADDTVTFYAPVSGNYVVSQFSYPSGAKGDDHDGMDVWYNVNMLNQNYMSGVPSTKNLVNVIPRILSTSVTGGLSLDNGGLFSDRKAPGVYFAPYRGVSTSDFSSVSYGSAEEPIAVLTHFVGWDSEDDSAATGGVVENTLQLEKQTADGLIGYKSSQANALAAAAAAAAGSDASGFATDFSPSYLVVEDRDENTGSLIASILFTPDADVSPAALGQGGTQAYSLSVNPGEQLLSERLAAHSDYADDVEGAAAAASEIAGAQQASDSMVVLANLDTMSAYNTGEKIYTLDIERLSGGAIPASSRVVLSYVTGSGDATAYTPSELYEGKAQATDATYVVDEDGYVTFGLYGGGVYAMALTSDEADVRELAAAFAAASSGQDDPDDGDVGDGDVGTGDAGNGDTGNGNAGNGTGAGTGNGTGAGAGTGTGTGNGTVPPIDVTGAGGSSAAPIGTLGAGGGSVPPIDADDVSDTLVGGVDAGDPMSIIDPADIDGLAEGIGSDTDPHGAVWNFFHNSDGSWIWWRILLLILLILILLALLVLLIRWLLAKRKEKQEDENESDGALEAGGSPAPSFASGSSSAYLGVAPRGAEASMTAEQATAAAVAAAAQAAAEAQKTRVM